MHVLTSIFCVSDIVAVERAGHLTLALNLCSVQTSLLQNICQEGAGPFQPSSEVKLSLCWG